jgi:uncharacterized protein YerC
MAARRRWGTNLTDFEQLSREDQYKFARILGGRRMYIPTVRALERRDRRRESVALINSNWTYSRVAAKLGVSTSTVNRDGKSTANS